MLYQLECIINDKDYYEFNKYHMKNAADVKKGRLLGKLIVPVMFLFFIIYYIARGYDWIYLRYAAIVFGVVSVIWFFAIWPLGLLFLKLHIRLMKKYSKIPYSSFTAMEFCDDNFVEKTNDTKTELKYDAIYKVCINDKKAIYIYLDAARACVIPFNAFESDEQAEEFIQFIKRKIDKEASERSV